MNKKIWSIFYHSWRLLVLFFSLVLLSSALLADTLGWLILIVNNPKTELIRLEPALAITLIVVVPPFCFSFNWLAALFSGIGLYSVSQRILSFLVKIWSLPLMPAGLGVPIAEAQAADYYRESGNPAQAEVKYELAFSRFKASIWKYFSGASLSFFNYYRMLQKLGRHDQAREIFQKNLIPLITYLTWSGFRIACCALIPIVWMNLVIRLYEDINAKQVQLRKLNKEVITGEFQTRGFNERLSHLQPALESVEWLYTPEGRIVICGGIASAFLEAVKLQTGAAKINQDKIAAFHVQERPADFARNNYLLAKWFLERALRYQAACPHHAQNYSYIGECLDKCNKRLEDLYRVASVLLEEALRIRKEMTSINSLANSHLICKLSEIDSLFSAVLQNKKDVSATLLWTAHDWLKKAEYHLIDKRKQISDSNLASESLGQEEIEKNLHQSGLILVYLMYNQKLDQEAQILGKQLRKLDEESVSLPELKCNRLLELFGPYLRSAQYVEARSLLQATKQISFGIKNKDKQAKVQSECRIAESNLCFEKEDYAAAVHIAKNNLDTLNQEAVNGEELANTYECLAKAQSFMNGKIDQAVANQKSCLELRQKLYGRLDLRTLKTSVQLLYLIRLQLEELGGGKAKIKDLAEHSRFITHLVRTLELQESRRNDNDFLLLAADANYELGNLFKAYQKYEPARQCFANACNFHMFRTESSGVRATVRDMNAMASLDVLEGNSQSARRRVLWASTLLADYINETYPGLSLAEQIALSHAIEIQMNNLLAVMTACNDKSNLSYPYGHLLRWKGFLINQMSRKALAIRNSKDHELKKLLSKHHDIVSMILEAYMKTDSDEERFQMLAEQKEELERKINEANRKVLSNNKESLATLPDLQAALGNEEALVDLYEYRPYTDRHSHYGAVITSKSSTSWIDLGHTADIDNAIEAWRNNLASPLPESKTEGIDKSSNPWSALQKLLAVPIKKEISSSIKRIWVADDNQLARIPWNVLLSDSSRGICLVDSPLELLSLKKYATQSAEKPDTKLQNFILVGGINYQGRASALPGASKEIALLRQSAERADLEPIVLSDTIPDSFAPATRENVISAFAKASLAHLATHGYFRDASLINSESGERSISLLPAVRSSSLSTDFQMSSRNPLIDSGLLVSITGTQGSATGFLTAEDILTADLSRCRLVTLSACETGRGRELTGQGVIGLRSALMGAGARSVLLSLWKVPDRATAELMKVFYQNLLDGNSPSFSLIQAQNEVRKKPEWRAPKYWAAWVLVGDGWSKDETTSRN